MLTAGYKKVDVAVIGAGPTGLSACLELAKQPMLKIALFESEDEIGGMPRSCHYFFGMRDLKRIYTGPQYAKELSSRVRRTPIEILTSATVTQIVSGLNGDCHLLKAVTKNGIVEMECSYILLATGCFESSREARRIPGTRPAGIFTTGSLQQLVNLQKLRPGKKAVIVGNEHVSLSAALSLHKVGTEIAAMVSEDEYLQTYSLAARVIGLAYKFDIVRGAKIDKIIGKRRVEGVSLCVKGSEKKLELECDTVVCTGKFRPDAALIYSSGIKEDTLSRGPEIDTNYRTSCERIFAAGNVLRGADMHDICALEGRNAAKNIIMHIAGAVDLITDKDIPLIAVDPCRFVVPQKISICRSRGGKISNKPGVSIQVRQTIKKAAIEGWSAGQKIWSRNYNTLIGSSRIPIPVQDFNWTKVNEYTGIEIKIVNR